MNIKSLLGNSTPVSSVTQTAKTERPIKMDSSHDRDPGGQQYSRQEQKKEKMTQEQFDKALFLLRQKNFIKDMNWSVSAINENGIKYALVQDQNGNMIRKIVEYELWEIFEDAKPEETKGQLLRKTA